MYQIITENIGRIGLLAKASFTELLGLTPQYVSNILSGKLATKELVAKSIICITYDIKLDDEKLEELLEKHFSKIK